MHFVKIFDRDDNDAYKKTEEVTLTKENKTGRLNVVIGNIEIMPASAGHNGGKGSISGTIKQQAG